MPDIKPTLEDEPKVRMWLSVLEGTSPQTAVPIFATEDLEIVQAVGKALSERMNRVLDRAREKGEVAQED